MASHSSAALVHGLELLISPSSPIELTGLTGEPRSRRIGNVVLHHCDDNDAPALELHGTPVTSLPRTVADTLRTRRLPHGTALLDAVLRDEKASVGEIVAVLDDQQHWRGRPMARAAVALADPRRESWLESYSFVRLHEMGVPLPLAQAEIRSLDGEFHGRTDGLLAIFGAFLEADGTGKYFLDGYPGESPEETVLRRLRQERVRHRGLEGLGLRGARWSAEEMIHRAEVVAGRVRAVMRAPAQEIRA